MPCNQIVRLTVNLSVACQHPTLLVEAIQSLGGTATLDANGVIQATLNGETLTIKNGEVTLRGQSSTRTKDALVKQIEGRYQIQGAKQQAKKAGWSFTMTGDNEFELTKRSL